MDVDSIPVAALLAMAISLFTLWRTERMQIRSRKAERFLLQQNVALKAEAYRSEWYALNRENNTLIHRLQLNSEVHPDVRKGVSDFLQEMKETIDTGIADASAFADDVHKNGASFSEDKCRDQLRLIEVSIEKLRRNQGVSERKFNELMERLVAYNAPTSGVVGR